MTCNSCVKKIEESFDQVKDIQEIRVDLEKEEAKVCVTEGSALTPTQIAQLITDVGFKASVADGSSSEGIHI